MNEQEQDHKLRLGIAKIEDLFIKNKLSEVNDGGELENINLIIPDYQRPYKWTVGNVIRLLDDIEEAWKNDRRNYRVGTLILHHDEKDNIYNIYNIVDGQQRTVTFSLILKAFSNVEMFKGYFPIEKNNFPNFKQLQLERNSFNISNVINNFREIERRIKRFNDNHDFLNYLLKNCEMVVVITKELSEAFQFFDSQNSRGKKLYPHDLLKAYHLREMNNYEVSEIIKTVKIWEDMDQKDLSKLFQEYLYRLKEWMNGNKSSELDEKNLYMFKGVTAKDTYPYSQFYKAAYSYADIVNHSPLQMVMGIQKLCQFQLNTPIIAGKPFFEYSKHYYEILKDIQDNDKYEGYFINDNEIVKTLDLNENSKGTGNTITRLIFDTAILLYVDRFCPEVPSRADTAMLDQFVIFAFIWAYSMRAQYVNVGWLVAQNYIMGTPAKDNIVNSFNIFKLINDSESPNILINRLSERLKPLTLNTDQVKNNKKKINCYIDENGKEHDEEPQSDNKNVVFINYLHYFEVNNYLIGIDNRKEQNEQQ